VSSVPAQVDCQAKRYCTQMKTCAEARALPDPVQHSESGQGWGWSALQGVV